MHNTHKWCFFFFQAVAVHIHPVCCSLCCAPSPHFHSVQWGAAHLPTELLHAVAQWISYSWYICLFFFKQGWHQTKHQIEICFKTGTEWTVVMPSRSILNRPVSKLIIITDREAVASLFNSVKFSNLSGMPVSHCEELWCWLMWK